MEILYIAISIILLIEFFTQGYYLVKIYKVLQKYEQRDFSNRGPFYGQPPYPNQNTMSQQQFPKQNS